MPVGRTVVWRGGASSDDAATARPVAQTSEGEARFQTIPRPPARSHRRLGDAASSVFSRFCDRPPGPRNGWGEDVAFQFPAVSVTARPIPRTGEGMFPHFPAVSATVRPVPELAGWGGGRYSSVSLQFPAVSAVSAPARPIPETAEGMFSSVTNRFCGRQPGPRNGWGSEGFKYFSQFPAVSATAGPVPETVGGQVFKHFSFSVQAFLRPPARS